MLDISGLIAGKNREDIYSNMDCTDISKAYEEFKEPLCEYVQNGFIEILLLGCIGIPLEIGLLFLGIRFVLRNKVDVPKYEPTKSNGKGKPKGDGAHN